MCGPHFCSMKTTEDVRKYAAEHALNETQQLDMGRRKKRQSFSRAEPLPQGWSRSG